MRLLVAVEPGVFPRLLVERAVGVEDVDQRQPVPLPAGVVVRCPPALTPPVGGIPLTGVGIPSPKGV